MKCPSCNNSSSFKSNDQPINQYDHLNILPNNFDLLECGMCGLHFKSNMPSIDDLKKFYVSLPPNEWEHSDLYPHERKLCRLLEALPNGSKVLDVGCGTGVVLGHFAHKHRCFGIEANVRAGEIASNRGITIIDDWISPKLDQTDYFDVVLVIDVFEHLVNPTEVVRTLYHRLKQGGRLIIVTGRTDCFPFFWFGPRYWYFQIAQHLVFLNEKYINWLRSELPGSDVKAIPIGHYDFKLNQFMKDLIYASRRTLSVQLRKLLRKKYRTLEYYFFKGWKDHYFIEIQKQKEKKFCS